MRLTHVLDVHLRDLLKSFRNSVSLCFFVMASFNPLRLGVSPTPVFRTASPLVASTASMTSLFSYITLYTYLYILYLLFISIDAVDAVDVIGEKSTMAQCFLTASTGLQKRIAGKLAMQAG